MSPLDSPAIYPLSTRSAGYPDNGGPVRSAVDDPGDELRNSGCRHLLIMVHGFNNSASKAKQSYERQMAALSAGFKRSRIAPDAVAFFHWPGDVGGWFSVAGYPWDIPRAIESAERLATYLSNFPSATNPGAIRISLVAHSLGCRRVLEMLGRALPEGLAVNIEIVNLMAPAVGVHLVDTGALRGTVQMPRKILKCFSDRDTVLATAFPAGQLAAQELGTEPFYYSEAVGLYGHPTGMGIPVQTSNKHGQYWADGAVASQFLGTLDPTLRTLPPTNMPAERALADTTDIAGRQLPAR